MLCKEKIVEKEQRDRLKKIGKKHTKLLTNLLTKEEIIIDKLNLLYLQLR